MTTIGQKIGKKKAQNPKWLDYYLNVTKPEVERIFDDLDDFLNFCRLNLLPYDPADLYRRSSHSWRSYEYYKRNQKDGHKPHNNNRGNFRYNKPRFYKK